MTTSLLLDTSTWDLCVDASGNIALANAPYSVTQDVACAARLFLGELWYDDTQGVPYFEQIIGAAPPPLALIKAQLAQAALSVPGVVAAQVFISSIVGRKLSGQIQITDTAGVQTVAGF